ncbi:MAG: MFS transporter [Rhodobacteraceae bacterium]|nr:MAG: MFS transporter [Paracoccaceae bacterium]
MVYILKNAWALLLGMMLLMLGNGLQGTLLGLRGAAEGFSPTTMSYVMSGYFLGFLGGSYMAPELIRRVGHVRVFAALGSLISAAFILYAALPNPIVWTLMRVIVGFCFAGVYVVAESWLNDAATNETRGQALSAYVIVQMVGIVAAQVLLNFADVNGYTLFVLMSVLVSLSFLPILLSSTAAPIFRATKRMTLKELFIISPLGCVGIFLLGGIFAALFGMAAVYGTEVGMSVRELSIFIGLIYFGGMIWQYPIGWISDKMDRRQLIMILTAFGGVTVLFGTLFADSQIVLYALAFVVGGVANPLYSLLIAYTNDYLEPDDMASASGGLIFINGVGAIGMPIVVGWSMTQFGPNSFFVILAILMSMIAVYAAYRTTKRAPTPVDETSAYATVLPQASPIAAEVAQEVAIEMASEDEDAPE